MYEYSIPLKAYVQYRPHIDREWNVKINDIENQKNEHSSIQKTLNPLENK